MNGWQYAWVDELPREIYDALITYLNTPAAPAPEPVDDEAEAGAWR
jgi:hypothetical protein